MIENRLKFREMTSMESGRTMVEILAVLAIMGVLTLGAVMGYRYAIDKLNANDIIDGVNKRAAVAAPQRVLHQPINLTEFHPNSEEDFIKGIYPIEAEDEVARNPDFFSLTVFDIQKGVCDRIMDSGYEVPSAIAVNSEVQQAGSTCEGSEDGKYDVTFIFDITLGNKEYEECEIDSDCPTDDICNQITGTCMQIPRVEIVDQNRIDHACNYSKIITLPAISGTKKNIAECEKCPNREFVDEIYCAPRCRACDPARVLTGGERYCRLEVCASDYYLSSDNTKCISCTTTEAVDVMNNETMRERCLACTDDNGNKMRRLNGQWCVLASQCPYGTQEDDPSTSDVDESIYCAECPENTFPSGNKCVSCGDRMWYSGVTEATCNERCNGTRFYRTRIQNYSWITYGNVCMLVKGEGGILFQRRDTKL